MCVCVCVCVWERGRQQPKVVCLAASLHGHQLVAASSKLLSGNSVRQQPQMARPARTFPSLPLPCAYSFPPHYTALPHPHHVNDCVLRSSGGPRSSDLRQKSVQRSTDMLSPSLSLPLPVPLSLPVPLPLPVPLLPSPAVCKPQGTPLPSQPPPSRREG